MTAGLSSVCQWSGCGVALAVKAALEAHNVPGKVILLGTPGMYESSRKNAMLNLLNSRGSWWWENYPPRKRWIRRDGPMCHVGSNFQTAIIFLTETGVIRPQVR
jgi:hypothetical protein